MTTMGGGVSGTSKSPQQISSGRWPKEETCCTFSRTVENDSSRRERGSWRGGRGQGAEGRSAFGAVTAVNRARAGR